ncbi:putative Acyl-coenzyme A thioesterase 13 [Hypsibius exemplaris]|uniref:Acyl-coenzyme A thioesterase 13 n=1 Tax=Hypsibius exemplaris TaxID=2072580 RepID=A0A1W0WWX1_HYPEX|nr:putative Acyl-coenzyme A thioesterase 13 [Hypsibius exemplaris]
MPAASTAGHLLKNFVKGMELYKLSKTFDAVLKTGNFVMAEPGKVHFEIEILKEHTNGLGGMHGGFVALLVDNITGAAITTLGKSKKPDIPFYSGVSVAMNLNYLSPGKLGETIIAKASVEKMGRTLVFTSCELVNKSDGKIIATGQHTKFL